MESEKFTASDAKLFYFLHKEENIDGVFHSTLAALSRSSRMNERTVLKGLKSFNDAGIIEIVAKVKGRNAGFAWIFSEKYRGLHNNNYEESGKSRKGSYVPGSEYILYPKPEFVIRIKNNYAYDPYLPLKETLQLLSGKSLVRS